ncbi:hypothetical protein PENARI_c003G12288 [Penicillium arizonense]|uniref:DUF4211 domain-containing protein n=1 Tax=Penicillium arizonense TaxID=1835702 RepID=A0A1F5LSS2_PENAI|nr:hypothetical protein PENARI_c003G12288 [Penicillium arizonense]OGE56254.1 hypothetical protein PENARI_c003G12288 [Penicillium arizonense]
MAPRKTTKKQTRLAFASAAALSGAASPEQSSRYSTLQYGKPSSGTYRAKPHTIESSATGTKSNQRAKPKKQSRLPAQATQAAPKFSGTIKNEPEPSLDDEIPVSQRKRGARSDVQVVLDNAPSKFNKSESSKKSGRGLQSSHKDSANTGISEELSSSRQKLKRKATSSPTVLSDSDEPIIPSSVRKRKPDQEESTPVKPCQEEDDDSDVPIRSSAVKRLRRGQEQRIPIETSGEEDHDSDEPIRSSPVKRLRRAQDIHTPQTPRTARNISDQAKLDIAEDLEDLQDSAVRKSRTRGHVAESARDKRLKHLETLRRRRAGLKEEESEEESEEVSDSDVQEVDQNGNQISPSTRKISWQQHDVDSDVESAIAANEDLDRYEDDFVLEDEQNDLGVPTEGIPLEFTRHAYKQPKDYFRDVVYWMVQNKLNPAFPRSDPMFKMAFMKLEDEVKGRSGSQLISSVWSPQFIYAIQARPSMDITSYPTEEDHPCDACRRSGHPASADLTLYGKAYSLETLEPLNDDDSDEQSKEDDDNENDGNDRDRDGHIIPPEGTHFYLGRTCKGRAELAHTLTHWRYHLNEWVIDYLDGMGHMADDEILKRNDMSAKKKTRNANDVLDEMVAGGIVDGLWRDFHISLRSAREKESIYA